MDNYTSILHYNKKSIIEYKVLDTNYEYYDPPLHFFFINVKYYSEFSGVLLEEVERKILARYNGSMIEFNLNQFQESEKHAKYVRYFENGTVEIEGNFYANYRCGKWNEYYEDGKIKSIRVYHEESFLEQRNILIGKKKSFFNNGNLKHEIEYSFDPFNIEYCGKKTNAETFYFENGMIKLQQQYKNDQLNGLSLLFEIKNDFQECIAERNFKEGKINGVQKFWKHINGGDHLILWLEESFKMGKRIESKEFDPRGFRPWDLYDVYKYKISLSDSGVDGDFDDDDIDINSLHNRISEKICFSSKVNISRINLTEK
jgi:antitoxin component YwqK of YwqJK toxin-antitoxin module